MIKRNVYILRNTVARLLVSRGYNVARTTFTPHARALANAISLEVYVGEDNLCVYVLTDVIYVAVTNTTHGKVPLGYIPEDDVPVVDYLHQLTRSSTDACRVSDDVKYALIGL